MKTRIFFKIVKNEKGESYFEQRIIPVDENSFEVVYGRVGVTPVRQKILMSFYNTYIGTLKTQGYTEREYWMFNAKDSAYDFNIENQEIKNFLENLASISRQFVTEKCVEYNAVTLEGIKKAKEILRKISECNDIEKITLLQKEMYLIIPRKTDSLYFSENLEEIPEYINKEYELLDAVETVLKMNNEEKTETPFFEKYGVSLFPVTDNQNKEILNHLGFKVTDKYEVTGYKVVNEKRDKSFEKYRNKNKCKTRYLYHGTRNENALSIILNGPLLPEKANATKTGAMFGSGIYTATDPDKSLGYTDGGRWNTEKKRKTVTLFVFKCASKSTLHVKEHKYVYTDFPKKLNTKYDTVYAHKGKSLLRDEIIFYDEDQITLQYILKLEEKKKK